MSMLWIQPAFPTCGRPVLNITPEYAGDGGALDFRCIASNPSRSCEERQRTQDRGDKR